MTRINPDIIFNYRLFRKAHFKKGIICPRCKSKKAYHYKTINHCHLYYCPDCRKAKRICVFHDLSKTVFHNCKISFEKINTLIYFFSLNKSAHFTFVWMKQNKYKISLKTVWRYFGIFRKSLLITQEKESFIDNHFEIDEVYLPCKLHTKKFPGYKTHKKLRFEGIKRGTGSELQTPVLTIYSKNKKQIKLIPIKSASRRELQETIYKNIPPVMHQFYRLETDANQAYKKIGKRFLSHDSVKHEANEYVNKETGATVNHCECIHGWIKSILFRIYRMISRKYLKYYLAEFIAKWKKKFNEDEFYILLGSSI